ncbi:SDR family oxidoreductase [Streptomyces sp. LP05-1]|uniref:SDR family oxidoreductase n=1 Tax=Streptomyces pyxinae TaxID=2970734 RepID=A0ABT2CME7_9ACTN|nr:SDR family oxidoreductase [Streptomyces sp. LP05-1]MCS0638608.1 SDR family oxidoreductase [Streptomyces sp. LP05-1]
MRSVVITGATSGIGKAAALGLAAHGFQVIGTARTTEKADKLTAAAAESGHRVRAVLLDVTDPGSCQDAVAEIAELTGGGPWALVNNAGLAVGGAFEDVSEADARAVLETNLLGVARMTRLVLPSMRRRGEGRIVQMSSVAGLIATPLNGWYSAGKYALEALTDVLRREIAASGIRVSLIEPGFIDTPMLSEGIARLPAHTRYAEAYEAAGRLIARRRPLGPDAVARTVRRALTAPNPRRRYSVGHEARMARLSRLLPPATVDVTMRACLRLNRV